MTLAKVGPPIFVTMTVPVISGPRPLAGPVRLPLSSSFVSDPAWPGALRQEYLGTGPLIWRLPLCSFVAQVQYGLA